MEIIVKTLYGLEKVLADELEAIGAKEVVVRNRAVTLEGDKEMLYRINYMSRTALSVLVKKGEFVIKEPDDLYNKAVRIDWSSIMSADDTFSIVSVSNSSHFRHTAYPGLVVKDAVADYFRQLSGKRPTVDTARPRIVINVHISNDDVTISVDSSVLPLFKRGYRQIQSPAPLNEALAAGIIMLTGWNGKEDFHDPMCGSGTFAVEAGMIAAAIPPGSLREFFGFMNWNDYDKELYQRVKQQYDNMIKPVAVLISGADISMKAVRTARENVVGAGLGGDVRINKEDFIKPFRNDRKGLVLFNPPYGKRINPGDTDTLYETAGSVIKHHYTGCEVWIFSGAPESMKRVGLRPSAKHRLFNGQIECQLSRFIINEGKYRGTSGGDNVR